MPISPESQYCLDSMHELCHITSDVYCYTWDLFLDLDGCIDRNEDLETFITNEFDENYDSLNKFDKAILGFEVLYNSDRQLQEYFLHLAERTTHAYYLGQNKKLPGVFHHTDNIPAITSYNDLNEIEKIFNNKPLFASYKEKFLKAYNRAINATSNLEISEYLQYARQKKYLAQLRAESIDANILVERLSVKSKKLQKRKKEQIKTGKKVLKKSMQVLGQFIGEDQTKAFIHGDKIEVAGHKFKFVMQKSSTKLILQAASPVSHHVPYSLVITDLSNNVLAEVCLLFRDTPILDQILAIHLHVANGMEDELIKKANLYAITSHGNKNADLKALGKIKPLKTYPTTIDEYNSHQAMERIFGSKEVNDEFNTIKDSIHKFILENAQNIFGLPDNTITQLLNPEFRPDQILDLDIETASRRLIT